MSTSARAKLNLFGLFVALLGLMMATAPQARADFFALCGCIDAENYAVLYEGALGNTLQVNTFTINGKVGVANTGKMEIDGGGLVNGNVNFSAANTGQFTTTGSGTATGTESYSVTQVQTDMTDLSTLSQTLGAETGNALDIAGGGSVNVTSGKFDSHGNYVFTATINSNFTSGTVFTITGTASEFVVINIPSTGGHNFNGQIDLSGGITSDHVLFNFDSGDYSTLSGGDALSFTTNCLSQSCATSGTYLDVNGAISINNSVLDGRLFGGDTQNEEIVSGGDINAPTTSTTVPEPASVLLLGTALAVTGKILRRRLS